MKVTKEEILMYEMPAITEYVSWPFFQTIIAKYSAWKVNTKMKRYHHRKARNEFFLNK